MKRLSIYMIVALLSKVHAMPPGEVAFPGSVLHQISSTETGRDYDLYVSIPRDLEDGNALPVIYVLDAHAWFKNVVSAWAGLRADKFVPACIVVGVAFGGKSPDFDALRVLDLTPSEAVDFVGVYGTEGSPGVIKISLRGDDLVFIDTSFESLPDRLVPRSPTAFDCEKQPVQLEFMERDGIPTLRFDVPGSTFVLTRQD